MHIAILGAGVTGLTLARRLGQQLAARPDVRITLLEGRARSGGWVDSEKCQTEKGRVLFEGGPRTLRPAGLAGLSTLRLVGELGLEKDVLAVRKGEAAAQKRYLFVGGRLLLLPSGLWSALRATGPLKGLVRTVARELFVPRRPHTLQDESIDSFFTRRFSSEIASTLASAMVHGIYAGDSRELSVRACFPSLWEAEGRYGSVVGGMLRGMPPPRAADLHAGQETMQRDFPGLWAETKDAALYSFRGGLSTLTDALYKDISRMPNVDVRLGTAVARLTPGEGRVGVHGVGLGVDADYVLSTLPSKKLSLLLPTPLPYITPSATVAVVNVAYDRRVVPVDRAFGYLVPRSEGGDALGVVFDSDALPAQEGDATGLERLTVMMGGWRFDDVFPEGPAIDEGVVLNRALGALRDQLKVTAAPIGHRVSIQQECIPQFPVGWCEEMGKVGPWLRQKGRGRLAVCGAGWGGVAVNDCVLGAEDMAKAVAEHVMASPGQPLPLTGLERYH